MPTQFFAIAENMHSDTAATANRAGTKSRIGKQFILFVTKYRGRGKISMTFFIHNNFQIVQAFTVPYISPLVLRRELETLLASEGSLFLSLPSMRISHPIIFWNMFYYCRRLELPTHLLTWVSPAVVIHCVQDMPRLPNANTDGQMPK